MGCGRAQERAIDPQDFDAFWHRERDRLHRALSLSIGDPALAAEAVDEAMVRALERWRTVGRYDHPAAWVYRVALNWATSWRRKWGRRPTLPIEQLERSTDDVVPDPDLHGLLAGLRPEQRHAVVLRFYLQYTPTEIADLLGIPVGTAKSHVHRGLKQLRATMEAPR